MNEIFSLVLIGISLSLDAFSLALSFGTNEIENKYEFMLSTIVGIFHFFMPLIGLTIGKIVLNAFNINPNILIGIILLILAFSMIKEMFTNDTYSFSKTFFGMILFAFSVSFDSFSTGIGLYAITTEIYLASIIFSIFSFSFTYIGLVIGKYAKKRLGTIAELLGVIILLFMGIVYLCK